jgi:uncharacterized protein
VKLQRPILVGGLGLSFALWMFDTWQEAFSQVGEVSLLSLLAVGGGLLLFKQRSPKVAELLELPCDRTFVENAILQTEVAVNQLANEVKTLDVTSLTEQISQLQAQIDRKEINIAVTGGKSVGKTSLIQVLASSWQPSIPQTISFHDTAPLFVEAVGNSDAVVLKNAIASDYVLFITNGDLTDSEFQTLQQLKSANQRAMLVFNKQDQYTPAERTSILLSLQQLEQVNVATSSAVPVAIKVRKHNDDGTVQEWMEQPAPDLQHLTSGLGEVLTNQGQQLIWATTVRIAQLLKADVKNQLNNVRKERATPVIEQYQWYSAAAAFANPVPALDILATAAINGQMVMDLGGIYQQKFSLEQAKTVAVEMGSLMVKLGLVELSTKAISTVLKSNAVTYAVGGVIQGVSAAYLTRVAGLALVEYFQAQEIAVNSGNGLNLDKLRQTLQNVFQQNQQVAFLQGFVSQGVKRLLPEVQSGEVVETMV